MVDELKTEMQVVAPKGVPCSDVQEAPWGTLTAISLPGDGRIGLYGLKHPRPVEG